MPNGNKRRIVSWMLAGVVGLVCGAAALAWWRTAHIGPVQRGLDVARARGCFACHAQGAAPQFPMAFPEIDASNEIELREWILDGVSLRMRADHEAMELRRQAAIRMPAWRDVLSAREVDAVVSYLRAVSGAQAPSEGRAREGAAAAARLGCFNCHGPEGRGDTPNPGSLKGYIPAWDGLDFTELAVDDAEIREWILDGRPQRLQRNPVARFFMDRQALQMPAFRGHVDAKEIDAIVAYIRWLRGAQASKASQKASREAS
jgi:mono/diheme cytochrome c family protein